VAGASYERCNATCVFALRRGRRESTRALQDGQILCVNWIGCERRIMTRITTRITTRIMTRRSGCWRIRGSGRSRRKRRTRRGDSGIALRIAPEELSLALFSQLHHSTATASKFRVLSLCLQTVSLYITLLPPFSLLKLVHHIVDHADEIPNRPVSASARHSRRSCPRLPPVSLNVHHPILHVV